MPSKACLTVEICEVLDHICTKLLCQRTHLFQHLLAKLKQLLVRVLGLRLCFCPICAVVVILAQLLELRKRLLVVEELLSCLETLVLRKKVRQQQRMILMKMHT